MYHYVEIGYVLLSCDLGSEKVLIDELSTIEGVKEVQGTYGVYDFIVILEVQEDHKLREIITCKIRKMNHIRSTITLLETQG